MNKSNKFFYIQPEDKHHILRTFYPNAEFDCLFYPGLLEEAIEDLKIPDKTDMPVYIITYDDELRGHLEKSLKEFYQKKYEEYNKDKDGKE